MGIVEALGGELWVNIYAGILIGSNVLCGIAAIVCLRKNTN